MVKSYRFGGWVAHVISESAQGPNIYKSGGLGVDTDIPALHPPALLVTVVCHIVLVIPDVAIRAVTVPASCPRGDKEKEAE